MSTEMEQENKRWCSQGQCTGPAAWVVTQALPGHTTHLCLHAAHDCCVLQLGQMPRKLHYLLFYRYVYNFTEKAGKCMVERILKHTAASKKQTQHQLHLWTGQGVRDTTVKMFYFQLWLPRCPARWWQGWVASLLNLRAPASLKVPPPLT